ncbi:MAG: hypothetical protein Q9162_001997 [Coniocarpon cinnabarinum]
MASPSSRRAIGKLPHIKSTAKTDKLGQSRRRASAYTTNGADAFASSIIAEAAGGDFTTNLDYDARVPIPISVFPSSYRSDTAQEGHQQDSTRVEQHQQADSSSRRGREDQDTRYSREDRRRDSSRRDRRGDRTETKTTRIYEEDDRRRDRRRRPETVREEDVRIYEERDRRPRHRDSYTEVRFREDDHRERDHDLDVERRRYSEPRDERVYESAIDVAERDYRRRTTPFVSDEFVEHRPEYPLEEERVRVEDYSVDGGHRSRAHMGYYDEDGHYHSFRHGAQRAADRLEERIAHPAHGGHYEHHHHHHDHHRHHPVREEVDVDMDRPSSHHVRYVERSRPPHTVTIPCRHIRIGDLLILQGRPCQVIRITISNQTGQYRYLGVDLFSKQLHEESSFVSHPSESVVVQNMVGPVFKEYRILDIRGDGRVVAMTETGDVKQGLPIIDQGGLWHRLRDAFDNGRGSVRVLVINDAGRELGVDYKVVHGARL